MDRQHRCRRCRCKRSITGSTKVTYEYPDGKLAANGRLGAPPPCRTIGHLWEEIGSGVVVDEFEQYRADLIAFERYRAMLIERLKT